MIKARLRTQTLQARIRAHFLFNSMNTIANLTRTSPEEAVEDLADLFRASLSHQDNIKLDEGLEFTRRYINIEELRLGDRLQIEWLIENNVDTDRKIARADSPALDGKRDLLRARAATGGWYGEIVDHASARSRLFLNQQSIARKARLSAAFRQ